jgi:uncharacterized protein
MTQDRFDPAKDAANLAKHNLPLSFGDRLLGDSDHLIIPSIRAIDGEERFKVIGRVEGVLFTGRLRLAEETAPLHLGAEKQQG